MKYSTLVSSAALLAAAASPAPAIDGVPEPGLIIYGQVYSQSAPTETVAVVSMAWNSSPGGPVGTAVNYPAPYLPGPVSSDPTYYIARVPYETVAPAGLTLTNTSLFDLSSAASDAHQVGFFVTPVTGGPQKLARIKSVNGVANPGPLTSLPTFQDWNDITTAKRGGLLRLDLIIDAPPSDPYAAWIAGYFGSGDPRAARSADPDGDGVTNGDEFNALTNPTSGANFFAATSALTGANLIISFSTMTGRTYTLQASNDLAVGAWSTTGLPLPLAGNGSIRTFTVPALTGRSFYRVQVSL